MSSINVIPDKDKLLSLDILPMSLYQAIVVLFAKILTEKVDIERRSHVTIIAVGNLANLLNDHFKNDILFDPHQIKLVGLYKLFSRNPYNE